MKNLCFAFCIALIININQAFASEAGMPQLDPEFWAAQVFWLLLIFSSLYLILWKIFLPKITDSIENRKLKVINDLNETQKLKDAAEKITMSKIFDNSTSCSSENAVIILNDVYDAALDALKAAGGYLATAVEKDKIQATLWVDGHLNRKVIAKDAVVFAAEAGLSRDADGAAFFMVEDDNPGPDTPFCDEKLSLVLTVYRASNFDDAMTQVDTIMDVCGRGHSVGIHTGNMDHARQLAEGLDTVRVLVNQPHTFGNGGSFTNGLEFTLSMGCGTWAGNSISENLNYRHFINITHLVTEIAEDKPSEDALFGEYWAKHGK